MRRTDSPSPLRCCTGSATPPTRRPRRTTRPMMAIRQGRFDFAEMQLERADRSARIADDVELLALILRETGKVRVGQGRVAEARSAFAAARDGPGDRGPRPRGRRGRVRARGVPRDRGRPRRRRGGPGRGAGDGRGRGTRLGAGVAALSPRCGPAAAGTPEAAAEAFRGRAGRSRRRRRRLHEVRSTCSAWPERPRERPLARARKPGPPWSRSASSCCPTGSTPSSAEPVRSSPARRGRTGPGAAGRRRCRACSTRSRCRTPQAPLESGSRDRLHRAGAGRAEAVAVERDPGVVAADALALALGLVAPQRSGWPGSSASSPPPRRWSQGSSWGMPAMNWTISSVPHPRGPRSRGPTTAPPAARRCPAGSTRCRTPWPSSRSCRCRPRNRSPAPGRPLVGEPERREDVERVAVRPGVGELAFGLRSEALR